MDSKLAVYTAWKVPTPIAVPTDANIIWSMDGSLFYLTKTSVIIMTPELGLNLRSATAIKPQHDNAAPISWFRTVIDVTERESAFNWNQRAIESETRSIGSFDLSASAMAISPTDMAGGASCILATLTTNMDLCLWRASKNFVAGPWLKVMDLTSFLLAQLDKKELIRPVTATLGAQITSITWSQRGTFDLPPELNLNSSFLLCGSRAGSIHFVKYNDDATAELVLTVPASDSWIVRAECSPWVCVSPGTCQANVAFAAGDGGVGIVTVQQTLVHTGGSSTFTRDISIQTIAMGTSRLYESDMSKVTSLKWVVLRSGTVLVHSRPGMVHLWSEESPERGWSGYLWLNVHNMYPVTGINYIEHEDTLVIAFFDGRAALIEDLSNNPTLRDSAPDSPIVTGTAMRQLISTLPSIVRKYEDDDVNGTHTRSGGFALFTNHGVAIWAHERVSLSDFSFTGHSKHFSMFMTAQLWDGVNDDSIMRELMEITGANSARAGSPLSWLRSMFFYFRDKDALVRLHPRILAALNEVPPDDSLTISLDSWQGELTPNIRRNFGQSLQKYLFGGITIRALRTRLSFADYAWKVAEGGQLQTDYGQAALLLLSTISHRNLRAIMRHLMAVVSALTAQDLPFVLRIILQTSLPECPSDIVLDAEALYRNVFEALPSPTSSPDHSEHCPACQAEIQLQDIITATCPSGHTWPRCSVTTFILTSTNVRTCLGCTRKAFLPSLEWESQADVPEALKGWVVTELLQAVQRCLFCGNSFVTLL